MKYRKVVTRLLVALLTYGLSVAHASESLPTGEEIAAHLNGRLPRMIDAETEWQSVAGNGKALEYRYRLVSVARTELTASNQQQIREYVRKTFCGSAQSRQILANGYSIDVLYLDKSGSKVVSVPLKKSSCP